MSNPNHHYEYATSAFGAASASAHPAFNEQVRSDALIQATLALAYEQRTANLIAIWQTGDIKSDGEVFGITGERRLETWREIAVRLGLS